MGLNGETAFSIKYHKVGYVAGESYGYESRRLVVTVDVRMEWFTRRGEYETTDHQQVSRPLGFAITTGVWRPDLKDIVAGGATVEPLRELVTYADGWGPEKVQRLIELSAWHLNNLTAGCVHQLETHLPCPVTGYRYGSGWLVRELPAGFLDEVKALFA